MFLPFSTTSTIAIALLTITIPLFIFTVSLLGNAIERAKEEKSKTQEEQRKDFEAKITDIENKVKKAKKTGDSTELETQLEKLKQSKRESEAQIEKIKKKYSLLEFKKCVLYPGSFFLSAIVLNEVAKICEMNIILSIVFWIPSIVAIGIGAYRLGWCLILAQEIAVTSEEFQTRRFVEAFRKALSLHDKAKLVELRLTFKNIDFPYTCEKNTEIKLDFRLNLKQGLVAREVEVWFFIPDGFGLISPNHSWSQDSDFVVPNVKTVSVKISEVNIGIYRSGGIKIRSPNIPSEYLLMYSLHAEGYSSGREQVKIIVTD